MTESKMVDADGHIREIESDVFGAEGYSEASKRKISYDNSKKLYGL